MRLTFATATEADAAALAALRNAAADHLTEQYGQGPWSGKTTDKQVRFFMRTSRVLIVRHGTEIVGILSLSTRKPWAILRSYLDPNAPHHFTIVKRPLYLTNMAVAPDKQRQGIGRLLLKQAATIARAWPVDSIRLDAYDVDSEAGAGKFYAKCGYREVARATYRKAPLIYFELVLRSPRPIRRSLGEGG